MTLVLGSKRKCSGMFLLCNASSDIGIYLSQKESAVECFFFVMTYDIYLFAGVSCKFLNSDARRTPKAGE
jgi:hypothetical protein